MNINVEIANDCNDWAKYPEINSNLIAFILEKILSRYKNFAQVQEYELSILFTNNNRLQALNKEFRSKESTTNVLSFPDIDIDWRHILEFKVNLNYMYLGDIAFAYQTIEDEAIEKNISFLDHFKHLLVHAILHLLGYDHNSDEEAEAIESLEIKILNALNVLNPY